jgi:hypothetical protein
MNPDLQLLGLFDFITPNYRRFVKQGGLVDRVCAKAASIVLRRRSTQLELGHAMRTCLKKPIGLLCFLLLSFAGGESKLAAGVLPPDAIVHGKTIGEWTAECWKWVYSIPTNQNPQLDCDSGEWATHRQPDSTVFMIAPVNGTTPGPCVRTFTVPADRYLLVPLLVISLDNVDIVPPLALDEMTALLGSVVYPPATLHATIDGVPVPNLIAHRQASPPFSFDFPDADNTLSHFYGHPIVGLLDPIISDGYCLMIEPLPPGEHIIRAGGSTVLPIFQPHDIICNIRVLGNHPPVADASATPTRVIAPDRRGIVVELNGSRSSDIDKDSLSYEWSKAGTVVAKVMVAKRRLSLGTHSIQLQVSDGKAQSVTTVRIKVLTPAKALGDLAAEIGASRLPRADRLVLLGLTYVAQHALECGREHLALRHLRLLADQISRRILPRNPALAAAWQTAVKQVQEAVHSR